MKNILGPVLLGMILIFSSCKKDHITGGGSVVTEERSARNFNQVSVEGSTNVIVTKGSDFSVKVKGYSNLLPYFRTDVVNGTLELGYEEHINVRHNNTEVFVTLPVLTGLSIAGSGDITSTGDFTNNNKFETNIFGSGSITMERGSTTNYSGSILGSGNVNAFGFTAEKATIEVSGSGNTKITVTNKLDVQIAGSGDVYYKGSPNVSTSITGSGKVVKQ